MRDIANHGNDAPPDDSQSAHQKTGKTRLIRAAKILFGAFGVDPRRAAERIAVWSMQAATRQAGRTELVQQLRAIVPDISEQESRAVADRPYVEIKRRALHAFQCEMMLGFLKDLEGKEATVIDIGDSAGTHMTYLKALAKGEIKVETLSVNLDRRAIEKLRSKGLKALQCRAEDLTAHDLSQRATVFTSFEMVEHLHNPALFFHRLAVKSPCNYMIITVPYLRQSRVGMHHIRGESKDMQYAEDVHMFELCPADWELLIRHSGWKVRMSKIHYQYPVAWPIVSGFLRWFWRRIDFEGFWGAVLEKDLTYSNLYADWED